MEQISRRSMCRQTLGSVLTASLLQTLYEAQAFGESVRPLISRWVADLDALGRELKEQRLGQIDWQHKVEELFSVVDLPDLLAAVDFEKLTKDVKVPDSGARSMGFQFPEIEGIPRKLIFGKQIFAVKKDRSVVPHGHNNMATAFLVLGGDLHGRHYDRIEDRKDEFIIRPTIDRNFTVGQYSTVSDYKDNIHWFRAVSDVAYIFNIHVLDTRIDSPVRTGRVYLNPHGEKLKGGLIRAPRINYVESHKLFG